MLREHAAEYTSEWAEIQAIFEQLGCTVGTLRRRVEPDSERGEGTTSEAREQIKALERENRDLRRAHEILRKASAHFTRAEMDRRRN